MEAKIVSPTSISNVKKKKFTINANNAQLYLLCSIPMLLFFVFNYLPMFGVVIAFKDYRFDKGILGSEWVGFKNFEFFFKSEDFYRIVRNTLGLNFVFIVVGTIAAVFAAILLFEITRRMYVRVYQTILIMPHFLSWVIVGYMVYAFLNPEYGFVNSFLKNAGLNPVPWYSKPGYWPFILTAASVWKNIGMNMVIYYAALMGIDYSYFEAARIDGANKSEIIRYITIPFLKPVVIVLTILAIGGIFRADFGLFYQLTRNAGLLYPTTDVVDTYVYRSVMSNMSMAAAIGLLQSFVGFVLVLLTNYMVKKTEPDYALF